MLRRGELSAARQDFELATRLSPALTPAWQNLARACQLQADSDQSALPCAIAAWQRVLTQKQGDSEAHLSLATLFNKEGKYSESLAELERLSAADGPKKTARLLRCAALTILERIGRSEQNCFAACRRAEFIRGRLSCISHDMGETGSGSGCHHNRQGA